MDLYGAAPDEPGINLESDAVALGQFFLPAFGDHMDLCVKALFLAVRPE